MQFATRYAHMTSYEADVLRKAMGKKKRELMESLHPKFVAGAIENGSTKELAEIVWGTMEGFGSYGFNKSHSVSYAINIYQSVYLKTHFPSEFMAALIQQGFGNPEKVRSYIQEAMRMKLKIGPVDINNSQVKMASTGANPANKYDIVFGFSGVKQMNDKLAEAIVNERNESGPYTSVANFTKRVAKRIPLTAAPLAKLSLAGAFDSFGVSRKMVAEKAKMIVDSSTKKIDKGVSLFDMLATPSSNSDVTESIEIKGEDFDFNEMIKLEADTIGLFISGHPTSRLGHIANMYNPTTLQKVLSSGGSKEIFTILGTVTQMKSKTNKSGNKSIAILIDDGTGTSAAYLPKNIVQSIEKEEEINKIAVAKKKGTVMKVNKRQEKILDLINDDSIKVMKPIEINEPYLFKVKTRGWGDVLNINIIDIQRLNTAPDGSLPYELNVPKKSMIEAIESIVQKHKYPKDKYPKGKYPKGAYVKLNLANKTSSILKTKVELSIDFIIAMENIVGKENIVTEGI